MDGKDCGLNESPVGGHNTESRADIEIEKHFEEEVKSIELVLF